MARSCSDAKSCFDGMPSSSAAFSAASTSPRESASASLFSFVVTRSVRTTLPVWLAKVLESAVGKRPGTRDVKGREPSSRRRLV